MPRNPPLISLDSLLIQQQKNDKKKSANKVDESKQQKQQEYHNNRRASLAPPPQNPLDFQQKEVLVRTPRRGKNTRSIVVSHQQKETGNFQIGRLNNYNDQMKRHKGPLSFISELDSIVEEGVSGSGPNESSNLIKKKSDPLVRSSCNQSVNFESYQNSKQSECSL